MNYSKEVERILKKIPSTWTMEEAEIIARTIQSYPYDNEIKNAFLNLNPENGELCNRVLYKALVNLHIHITNKYKVSYSLEEYIESVSYIIWKNSLIDWRPGDSLMFYIRYSSLSNGSIGYDIGKQYYLLSHRMNKNKKSLEKMNLEEYEENHFDNAELCDILRSVTELTTITMEEIKIAILAENDHLNDGDIETINSALGTYYDKKQINQIRERFHRKAKRYRDILKELLLP